MSGRKKPNPKKLFKLLKKFWKVALIGALVLLVLLFVGDRDRDDAANMEALGQQCQPNTVVEDMMGADAPANIPDSGPVELLVNLDDDRDDLEAELESRHGFDLVLNSIHADDDNLFVVTVDASDAESLLSALSNTSGVEHAEVNGSMEAFGYTPNDPLYMYQWNFDQVNAEEGWSMATGEGVVVSVIDTGVAYEDKNKGRKRGILVPDLKNTRMVRGYDFVDDDEAPYDQHGHGTHVAGTVAQDTDNDYGVAGLAYGAQIMPVRVLDGQGRGNFSDVADAIRYSADMDADVLNLSLGSFVPSREVESAIQYAHDKGVVVVAAAGNSGTRIRSYPAAFDHVIAVAATQYDKTTTFYSNYGSYIDIAAPGGNVLVDQNDDGKPDGVMQETLKRSQDGNVEMEPVFSLYMGTSMAAPHVAAAAALLVQNGISNPDEVEEILTDAAADAGKDGWDERYGHGILDVSSALKKHTVENGLWRVGTAFILALLALVQLRRRNSMELGDKPRGSFWAGWTLGAGALFFLPLLFGQTWLGGEALTLASRPFTTWDSVIFGPGSENPIFISALPVLLGAGLLLGWRRGRHAIAGFGLATGAVLMVEALRQTIDVAWIPGVGVMDQTWLAINGLAAATIGYVALKRR